MGDYFGERALLGEEVRTASIIAMNPGVEVLTLDRESFLKLIGDLESLKRDYGDLQRRATHSARTASGGAAPPSAAGGATTARPELSSPTRAGSVVALPEPAAEFAAIQLRQLKRIATLGVGGFGRVELVCINGDKSRTFALKVRPILFVLSRHSHRCVF